MKILLYDVFWTHKIQKLFEIRNFTDKIGPKFCEPSENKWQDHPHRSLTLTAISEISKSWKWLFFVTVNTERYILDLSRYRYLSWILSDKTLKTNVPLQMQLFFKQDTFEILPQKNIRIQRIQILFRYIKRI